MKIAVIGAGISGLGAAYLLHTRHDVRLYEKNAYLGGHSRTVEIPQPQDDAHIPVDTGFIVFNKRNYPLLTALFDKIGVPYVKSSMSFGVSIDGGFLEYGTESLFNLFAQKKNLVRSAFWRMLYDILRFNRRAPRYLTGDASLTLGEYLDSIKAGKWFRNYYLLAMGGAIWSTPVSGMLDFPAKPFIRFFNNHGLLSVNNQPQWYSVKGGSREYIARITATFDPKTITGRGATRVVRSPKSVTVYDSAGQAEEYDAVVFACHADEALELLEAPTAQEKKIIGSFSYQKNTVVLHRDTSFMPKNKKCWSSWVYLCDGRQDGRQKIALSYWMNNLQELETQEPVIVTMNPDVMPEQDKIFDVHEFTHPVFDQLAAVAQNRIHELQGENRTWYCGAYQRYGFHEDGLWSAVHMAEQMGVKRQW